MNTKEVFDFVMQFGPCCRDCADEDRICPSSGLPCEGKEKAVWSIVHAIDYGIKNGFIKPMMTNQYALGFKACQEAAVKVCRDVVDSVSTTVHEQKLIDLVLEQAALRIAALPVQEVPLPKTLEGGYELCEDEGCPHRGTVHYCRSVPEFKWRDLTDEEIEAIAKENDTWSLFKSLRIFDFANAVTAKFKEKQRV